MKLPWRQGAYLAAASGIGLFAIASFAFCLSFTFVTFENLRPRLQPGISTAEIASLDLAILARTAGVSSFASILAFWLVETVLRPRFLPIKLVFVALLYGIDPVTRTLSLRSAYLYAASQGDAWLPLGSDSLIAILLVPGVALALSYAPLYGCIRAWDMIHMDRDGRQPPRRLLFTVIQPSLRRAPLGLGILFLFCLFDPWTAPLASGNMVDYWGMVAFRRALQRDIDGSLLMCFVGFATALIYVLALFYLRSGWDRFFPRLKPWPRPNVNTPIPRLGGSLWMLACSVAAWPYAWALVGRSNAMSGTDYFSVWHVLVQTFLIASLIAAVSAFVGMILIGCYHTVRRSRRAILVASWMLVLMPELVFSIGSTLVTGSQLVSPGLPWAVAIFVSFGSAIMFLIFDEFLSGSGSQYVPILRNSAATSFVIPIRISLLGLRRELGFATALVFWLACDNMLLLKTTLGANVTTTTITLFAGASRGLDPQEAVLAVLSAIIKVLIVGLFWAGIVHRRS